MSSGSEKTVQVKRTAFQRFEHFRDILCGEIDFCQEKLSLLNVNSDQTGKYSLLLARALHELNVAENFRGIGTPILIVRIRHNDLG